MIAKDGVSALEDGKHSLCQALWPSKPRDDNCTVTTCEKLIEYVQQELGVLKDQPGRFAVQEETQVYRIICALRSGPHCTKSQLTEQVKSLCINTSSTNAAFSKKCQAALELAIRIWLMTNVDSFDFSAASSQFPTSERIPWKDENMSLRMLLDGKFQAAKALQPTHKRIPRTLTLANFCFKYNYSIRWTSNLPDHLTISERGAAKEIVVFDHLVFLKNHVEYSDERGFRNDILNEAIETLVLLFPKDGKRRKATKRLLKKNRELWNMLSSSSCVSPKLQLDHYLYWRERIEEMMDILATPPPGWKQAFLDEDQQNFEKVTMFWITSIGAALAVAALVFGILSIILAFEANRLAHEANTIANASLDLAYEANQIAKSSFELDRRQACSGPNATEELGEFCR